MALLLHKIVKWLEPVGELPVLHAVWHRSEGSGHPEPGPSVVVAYAQPWVLVVSRSGVGLLLHAKWRELQEEVAG